MTAALTVVKMFATMLFAMGVMLVLGTLLVTFPTLVLGTGYLLAFSAVVFSVLAWVWGTAALEWLMAPPAPVQPARRRQRK